MPPRQRVLRHATVIGSEQISPQLIRLTFDSPDLRDVDLPFTDHYVKLLFPPQDAPYTQPVDPEETAEFADHPPVTRTYSLRHRDPLNGTMEIDFVTHGDTGLAGPWAQRAKAGDRISFFGPGGAWAPTADYDHFVLVGDEAAAPAICAALEELPHDATAVAFLEVADHSSVFDVPSVPGVEIVWVFREGAPYGLKLAQAVREAEIPEGRTSWFVHGVAEMVKDLRRHLFVERGVAKQDASISGYWRTGMTEDGWQSSKHEFVAGMEAEEAAALGQPESD